MSKKEESDIASEYWLQMVAHMISDLSRNSSVDLKKPHLQPTFKNNYWVFIVMYYILIVFGACANIAVIFDICRRKLYHDTTFCFIVNLAISDFLKCVVVLPISLAVLLVQNWVFGQFLCFFLPLIQDIPLHVSTLTFLLIAIDRYRFTRDPTSGRLVAFVCATGTWFFAVCIVLPYLLYITYIDLGTYESAFQGVSICILNLADDMQEYMRTLFLIMYAAPMATITYLYVKSSRDIQRSEDSLAVQMYETHGRHGSSAVSTPPISSTSQHNYHRSSNTSSRRRYDMYEAELDVFREKRNHRYHVTMVTVYAICLCPLMVLRLARLAITETYENSRHLDIAYVLLVWFGYVPTCAIPCLYASWQMTRDAKERLRNHFRFGNRKLRHNCEHVDHACVCGVGEGASVVSYVHKTSNASSCQVEHLCPSS